MIGGYGNRRVEGLLPFGIYPHELQFLPAALDDVLDAEVELAAHDDRVRLARELIEKAEADAVDFVVDV